MSDTALDATVALVVIPARNEEALIGRTLEMVCGRYLHPWDDNTIAQVPVQERPPLASLEPAGVLADATGDQNAGLASSRRSRERA